MIEQKKKENPENQFEVTFSMIEIYNEIVRNLLCSKGAFDKKGLQLHEKPGKGFHSNLIIILDLIKLK